MSLNEVTSVLIQTEFPDIFPPSVFILYFQLKYFSKRVHVLNLVLAAWLT